LHEVVDEWFIRDVRPKLDGHAVMVRYADDIAVLFKRKQDAERFLKALPERFGRYGLTLHPDKTRLVPFSRPDLVDNDDDRPGTFNLLGFTHYWGKSREGTWVVMKRTAKDRFSRALRRVSQWCRWHRHDRVKTQHLTLTKKLEGHYAYFGVTANFRMLAKFLNEVKRAWRRALARRSQQRLPWRKMQKLLERYPLPAPRIVHRYGT
jgi:RNA-directed DNA polymerase